MATTKKTGNREEEVIQEEAWPDQRPALRSRDQPFHRSLPMSYVVGEGPLGIPQAADIDFESYKRLVDRASDVFGDELVASRWLSTPNRDLKGETPLQAAQAEGYQYRVLEALFVRIEHGVYS